MPFGKSKNSLNQSALARPNAALSSKVSAPPIVAQMGIKRMSHKLCLGSQKFLRGSDTLKLNARPVRSHPWKRSNLLKFEEVCRVLALCVTELNRFIVRLLCILPEQ